jgi:hypothetical protein
VCVFAILFTPAAAVICAHKKFNELHSPPTPQWSQLSREGARALAPHANVPLLLLGAKLINSRRAARFDWISDEARALYESEMRTAFAARFGMPQDDGANFGATRSCDF